jgi:DNA-binding transcriptional MerR regulator
MGGGEPRYWKVGELAGATGLTVRALHHYDRLGLLVPSQRTHAGHRLYGEADVSRLYHVLALRDLGFSLAEVGELLDGVIRRR